MFRNSLLVVCVLVFTALAAASADAQASRKSVSASEVTGTFRYTFPAKFRGAHSDIKIKALGNGKLMVDMDLSYPYILDGEVTANEGTASGEAVITGDTAEFQGGCKITIKFVRQGTIKVTQHQQAIDCGFGLYVSAGGTYKKISNKTPNFDQQ